MRNMYFRLCIVTILCVAFSAGLALAKQNPTIERIPQSAITPVYPAGYTPSLAAADTCFTNLGGEAYYYISPWVMGDELYKAYQDPAQTCSDPYPFMVNEVHLPLVFLGTGTIYLSVDIEAVNNSVPSCPTPGTMLAISQTYEVSLENDFYLITIPLDTPVVVNGPFFVGAYFASSGNPDYAAVVTDTFPTSCVSYNDWGEGYVDLDTVYNDYGEKIFLGRMLLYASGFPGGSGVTQPEPAAEIIHPANGELVGGTVDLWANDASGSDIISQCRFQYNFNGQWLDIGTDYSDDPPLRNGVTLSGAGDGLSYTWNTASLPDGNYAIRAIITDTLGQADTAQITVAVDATPPFPSFDTPSPGGTICEPFTAQVSSADEDISYMVFDIKPGNWNYSIPVVPVSQYIGGDMDGDPTDGNPSSSGEFGNYCSGPAAAAMAIRYWYMQGYNYIMLESGTTLLTDVQLMDQLFASMHIEDNTGTYDGEFISALRDYILVHGAQFKLDIDREPSAALLRSWIENYEYAVMLGISGDPGLWMTVTGGTGLADGDGNFTFRLADPMTAMATDYTFREMTGQLQVLYNGVWHDVDIMVGMVPNNWSVARTALGYDANGADGWGFYWDTSLLDTDSLYYLTAHVYDNAGHNVVGTAPVWYTCSVTTLPGDINGDGLVNPVDLVFMTNYLYNGGAAPPGGRIVTDVNCDNGINLADVIYLYKYLLLSGPAPCN